MKKISTLQIASVAVYMLLSVAAVNAEVTIKQSGNTLNIRGDKESDQVLIQPLGPNVIAVTVNNNQPLEFSNVANLKINLGKGANQVNIFGVDFSGSLDVNMGGDPGNYFKLTQTTIAGNLKVRGASDTSILLSTIGRDFSYQAGFPVDLDGDGYTMLAEASTFFGRTTIRGSSRFDDQVALSLCDFISNLDVRLGGGDDYLLCFVLNVAGNVNFDGGRGNDTRLTLGAFTVLGAVKDKGFEILLF